MTKPAADSSATYAPPEVDMTRTYALVLVVEAIVAVVLYWLGVHFG